MLVTLNLRNRKNSTTTKYLSLFNVNQDIVISLRQD